MNEEKVLEVLAQIQRSERGGQDGGVKHYQGDWVQVTECGTTACMAGWTTLLDGWVPELYRAGEHGDIGSGGWTADDCTKGKEKRDIDMLARELLGLTGAEASRLFYCSDDLSELYEHVAQIMGIDVGVLEDKVTAMADDLGPFMLKVPAP